MRQHNSKSLIKLSRGDRVLNVIIIAFTLLLLFLIIYPLYFTVLASVSDPYEVVRGHVYLFPKGFTLDAYKAILKNTQIWTGYANTIKYTIGGTSLSLLLTIPCAYGLSKKKLIGHSFLSIYFLIPMYFGGGLIPTFLQVKRLGLVNTPYTLIVLSCVSVYNMIVCRVYYQSTIPEELYESARIDGSGEARTFFSIALPLSKPIIAVMALFYAVSRWNDYFLSLIYISKSTYEPLQSVLRSILLLTQSALSNIDYTTMTPEEIEALTRLAYLAETLKYALIFVASAPLLIAYPFVQKHFIKGMMIGALKG